MRQLISILFVVLFLGACSTTRQAPQKSAQLAALYNPSEYSLNLGYRVFHASDEVSYLFVRIFPGELLFNQANEQNELRALVQVDYMLYELDAEGEIFAKADSAKRVVKLLKSDIKKAAFFSSMVMRVPKGKQYLLRLESLDMQRGTLGLEYLYVDKRNTLSAQNFNILNPSTGFPKFKNYYVPGEVFKINYREVGYDTVFLDFMKDNQKFPKPPVNLNSASFYPYEPDTSIVLAYSDSTIYTLPEEGTYHFRLNSDNRVGVTLNNYGSDFPRVKTEGALLEPLFYLATTTEYGNLLKENNKKLAVDDFWLQRTGSTDRSRELIRIYYNRVLYSNLYFTASREGWKTDRGMVFILLGPPDRMKDTGAEQIWYYISRRQGKVVSFIFDRRQSQYSNQTLELRKTVESMNYWSAAVSSWRKGKVYSISN